MRVRGQRAPKRRGQESGSPLPAPVPGCPGGRPRNPDLLAEVVQRTFPRQHRPDGRPPPEPAPLCSARNLLLASWLRVSSVFRLVTGKSAPLHQDRCQPGFSAFLCLGGKRGQAEPVICDHTA